MTSKDVWARAAQLVPDAISGDQAATGRLIELTQRDVWRFIAAHIGTGDADDLTQETYLRALRTLSAFQGRSSIRTWLLVIARRVVIDQLRQRAVRPRTVSVGDWQQLADSTRSASSEFTGVVELNDLLAGLSEERREALILTQVIGLEYREAAEICNCPIGTIRSRVARARDDLVQWSAGELGGQRAANR